MFTHTELSPVSCQYTVLNASRHTLCILVFEFLFTVYYQQGNDMRNREELRVKFKTKTVTTNIIQEVIYKEKVQYALVFIVTQTH